MADLRHIDTWIFDLDNTLYSAECRLFAQIDARMAEFIERTLSIEPAEARRLQKAYYVQYGTTMSGLMREHSVSPNDFLSYVHDIDLSAIKADDHLRAAISELPGKRYIFTNGSSEHAENVSKALGVDDLFHDMFDIRAAEYTPKPHLATYEKFVQYFDIFAENAVMFEDIAQNLKAPKDLGMTTVLVASDAQWLDDEPREKRPARPGETEEHIDYATTALSEFLSGVQTSVRQN